MRIVFFFLLVVSIGMLNCHANEKTFSERDVTFNNDSIKLAGTLSIPNGEVPFPGVVLLTGSGPENRDEEVYGFKIFKVIADHLATNGIAVLRFDDRGVGESGGEYQGANTLDFADDAIAAFKFLEKQAEIDKSKSGMLGHSEGGIIATLANKKLEGVDFIVFMASTAVSGDKIINYQIKAYSEKEGLSDEMINQTLLVQNMAYEAARRDSGFEAVEEEIKKMTLQEVENMSEEERKYISDPEQYAKYKARMTMMQVKTPWFKFFTSYDPAKDIEDIKCPVLVLFGGKDKQVPVELNKEPMENALMADGLKNFKTVVFPDANHLFQKAETGMYDEYTKLPKVFVDGFLETISTWINDLNKQGNNIKQE